jgi:hypothetical protein
MWRGAGETLERAQEMVRAEARVSRQARECQACIGMAFDQTDRACDARRRSAEPHRHARSAVNRSRRYGQPDAELFPRNRA